MLYYINIIFFFKQKTAYEMRISDWSSDVCSSDLREGTPRRRPPHDGRADRAQHRARAVRGRHAGEVRRPDDRRRCRGDRQGRGSAQIPRGDEQDRARKRALGGRAFGGGRSEEQTYELQSLMRVSSAVFRLKKQ